MDTTLNDSLFDGLEWIDEDPGLLDVINVPATWSSPPLDGPHHTLPNFHRAPPPR